MNLVIFSGRATKKPELILVGEKQTEKYEFSVAVDDSYKQNEEWVNKTIFIDINAWGKQGAYYHEKINKGDLIIVTGKMKLDSYEKDGQKKKRFYVIPSNIKVLQKNVKKPETEGLVLKGIIDSEMWEKILQVQETGIDNEEFCLFIRRDDQGNLMKDLTGKYMIDGLENSGAMPF